MFEGSALLFVVLLIANYVRIASSNAATSVNTGSRVDFIRFSIGNQVCEKNGTIIMPVGTVVALNITVCIYKPFDEILYSSCISITEPPDLVAGPDCRGNESLVPLLQPPVEQVSDPRQCYSFTEPETLPCSAVGVQLWYGIDFFASLRDSQLFRSSSQCFIEGVKSNAPGSCTSKSGEETPMKTYYSFNFHPMSGR